jgi:hypothetical protein
MVEHTFVLSRPRRILGQAGRSPSAHDVLVGDDRNVEFVTPSHSSCIVAVEFRLQGPTFVEQPATERQRGLQDQQVEGGAGFESSPLTEAFPGYVAIVLEP